VAYMRPAALLSQFTQYYLECRMFTNGVLAQTLTTAPVTYYHFTNTVSGDTAVNVLLNFTNNAWSRTYAVKTIPGQNTFQANVGYEIRRYDDFNAAQAFDNIPIVFNCTLRDNTGASVPLVNSNLVFYESVANHSYIFTIPFPAIQTGGQVLDIQPVGQLDSVNKTYYLTVTLAHTNNPVTGQVVTADTLGTTTNELLHFNGNLAFGNIGTTMTGLAGTPPVNPPSGGSIATTLSGAGGYVTQQSNHTYSGGSLNVALLPNGNAVVTGGSVVLAAPSPDADSLARVNFKRGPVTLTSGGGSCDFTVTLPAGFGYRLNDISNMLVTPYLPFTGVSLTPALDPTSDLNYLPGVTIFAVEETKPVWLKVENIFWHVSLGTFDIGSSAPSAYYTAADEYAYLNAPSTYTNLVDPGNMADKRSNDKYWMAVTGASAAPTLRSDAQSNALMSAKFQFGPGSFRAHFPYNSPMRWTGSGSMQVVDDLVVPGAGSQLSGVGVLRVQYTRDCPDCGSAGAGLATPGIVADGGVLNFTADGGLIATGPTAGTVNLQWGAIAGIDYAQQAFGFTNGVMHMPGVFLRGDQNLLSDEQGPSTILYSGFAGTNLNYVERPLSKAYTAGLADYAGLNFRCDADSLHAARSTIAGQPNINWSLTGRSKYYVRYGGVCGIHEAVPGTFPTDLVLWGYKFTFSNYGLSYLDSKNKDSLTDGQVALPSPAHFVQAFEGMKFSCLGAPTTGDVPANDPFKVMAYWAADFKTHSITFKGDGGCAPTAGYLVLGIEGYASHVSKPLYGQVGFFANGDQIPPSFGLDGVTSRLKLPNTITVGGPNGNDYTFTPAENAYYNTYASAASSGSPGWINIFGKLNVPFFEDLQVHWQTSCHTNGAAATNSLIYLSGGWPRPGSGGTSYGWNDGSGCTPFETNLFDVANAGWPGSGGGLTVDQYRENTSSQQYHPRAQRLWLGVVNFDYPLSWNPSLRSFKSYQEVTGDLLVLTAQHQVKYMDAKHAEIDFGAQYTGLPQISLANIAFNAIDEATGVSDAITKAATKPINDALNAGMEQMDQMLNAQLKDLMDGAFKRTVDPIIDNYYADLSNHWASTWSSLPLAQRQLFVASAYTNGLNFFVGTGPNPAVNNLTKALRNLGNGVNTTSNLIGQLQDNLRNVTNAINAIIGVVRIGTNGQDLGSDITGLFSKVDGGRPIIPKLAQSLVGDLAPQFINATVGPTLSNLVQQAEPAMAQINQTLGSTENAIMQVSAQLSAAGQLTSQIDDILNAAQADLADISLKVSLSTTQYFGKLNYNIDNPFQSISADDVKKYVRQQVEDQFFASDAAAQIQTALRQRLYDLDSAMKQQVDSVFQQLNGVLREVIGQSLAGVDKQINECLGSVKDVMGAGEISGHADIVGNSLKLLRIDGHFQFKVPDKMELNAFLEIKELSSDGSKAGCSDTNAPFTEVTLGATKVPMDWISSGLTADIETKFTFDGVHAYPVNLGGQLSLDGDIDFETFVLHDLAAAMAFGSEENYVALKGGVRFNGYDFSGAVFFGKTCSLDPLMLIDPDVAKVLGQPPFTGGYVYAQGWLPVSEMLTGVPASCLFEISAGVGAGAFYFAEGPTYGGKMFLGVSGSLLCIVSIEGDITMIGLKHGSDMRFSGDGHFEADLGPCPFCISISKDVSITYINNSWSIQ
jgi:hypothetical protein